MRNSRGTELDRTGRRPVAHPARTGPRGQATSPCVGTKDSADKGLREPPAPTSPPGWWVLSGSDATFGSLDQQLGLYLSTSTSRYPARRQAGHLGPGDVGVQADTPSLCRPQPFIHHNHRSVLPSWATVYEELFLYCLRHHTEMPGATQRLGSVRTLQ